MPILITHIFYMQVILHCLKALKLCKVPFSKKDGKIFFVVYKSKNLSNNASRKKGKVGTMKADAVVRIANAQGRFTIYYNNGEYDRIVDELFAKNPDVSINLRDAKLFGRGVEQIRNVLKEIAKRKADAPYKHKELHMINSPIVRVSSKEKTAQAIWATMSYIIKPNESASDDTIIAEPLTTRMDVDFINEDGEWRIQNLDWYIYTSLNPWECPKGELSNWANNDSARLSVPAYSDKTCAKDWQEIQRLQSGYSQARRRNAKALFAKRPDTSFYLPGLTDKVVTGYDDVCALLDSFEALEEKNAKLYLNTLLTMNPVIEIGADGVSAEGSWLGISISILGPAYGNSDEKPCPVAIRFLEFKQSFVKEDGIWKYLRFRVDTLFCTPEWIFDPAVKAGLISHDRRWQYPPEYVGAGTPDDVYEIENVQGYWVHTLKIVAGQGEIVNQVVAFEDPGVEYHTHDPFMEAHDFNMERTNNNVVGAIGIDNYRIKAQELDTMMRDQGHHASSHITTTPYIVVHEDGIHATAYFLDFGWTLRAEAFGLPPEKWDANPGFARYAQEMVKTVDGRWRILKFSWFPIFRFQSAWPFKDENIRGWAGSKSPDNWPKPFEKYVNDCL